MKRSRIRHINVKSEIGVCVQRRQHPDFRDTLEEMQHLVVDTGEIMKDKVERIVDLLEEEEQVTEEVKEEELAIEEVEQEEQVTEEVKEEDRLADITPRDVQRMRMADLIEIFSPVLPNPNWNTMKRYEMVSFVLREYFGIAPVSKNSKKVVTEAKRSRVAPMKVGWPTAVGLR